MIINNENLTDCVKLSSLKTDKFKASVISFTIYLPLSKSHYAHNLLLSHILRRGTKAYPSTALLNKKLDELYGSYLEVRSHRIGENLSLSLTAEILNNKYVTDGTDILGEIISVAAELILSPAFIEENFNLSFFEQEKKIICENVDSEINNTRLYAAKRCAEIINEKLDIPTSAELKDIISDATIDSLKEYYHYLINHAPMHIFYVGSHDEETLKNKVSAAFAEYPCRKPMNLIYPRPITRDEALELSKQMPVSQGKLSLGFSTGISVSKDNNAFYTATLLNEILGGSAFSKLFLNVREKLGICYYCSSSLSGYSGVILISSGFEVKNYDLARNAILSQIEDIKQGRISDAELDAAKRSLTSSYLQIFDSPTDLQSFFGNRALFGIEANIEETISNLLTITREDIVALAANIKLIASYFVEGTLGDDNESNEESEDENE